MTDLLGDSKKAGDRSRTASKSPLKSLRNTSTKKTRQVKGGWNEKDLRKPNKLGYWTKDDKFFDDGTDQSEPMNILRRKVAELRAEYTRLLVSYNDLKSFSTKEI